MLHVVFNSNYKNENSSAFFNKEYNRLNNQPNNNVSRFLLNFFYKFRLKF